jgi:hypothetical protein
MAQGITLGTMIERRSANTPSTTRIEEHRQLHHRAGGVRLIHLLPVSQPTPVKDLPVNQDKQGPNQEEGHSRSYPCEFSPARDLLWISVLQIVVRRLREPAYTACCSVPSLPP